MIVIIGTRKLLELLVVIEDLAREPVPPVLELKSLNCSMTHAEIDLSVPKRQKSIQKKKKSVQFKVSSRSKLNMKRTRFPA